MIFCLLRLTTLLVLSVFPGLVAFSQESGGATGWELGAHFGRLLPNQITGVTEILGVGGLRFGARLGEDTFGELDFVSGNSHGCKWTHVGVNLRLDLPIERMVGMAYVGPSMTYYSERDSTTRKVVFGGHVGGSLMNPLGGITWFRADMRFSSGPGTSLYFGLGFVFRLEGSGFSSGGS